MLNTSSYALGKIATVLGQSIRNPIFILGSGRCGTTLLHEILRRNKNVCIYPTEANELWHPYCYPYSSAKIGFPPILKDPGKFTQMSVRSWPFNHDKLIRTAFAGYQLLNYGSTIFVVKSAMISHMIPAILSIFNDARFIHLYRNGISVIDSLFKKERQKYLKVFPDDRHFLLACARYWAECISEIELQDKRLSLSNRKLLYQFSYEELCSKPESQISALASFIGCRKTDFLYDCSQIHSTNYKVGDYHNDKKWEPVMDIIYPMMIEKGYL
jgi:hypothetical protein